MKYTFIPTGKDPVVNEWLHKLGKERAEQWLKDHGAKTTEDDNKQTNKLTHFVHGDNDESIKITVRWHYDDENKATDAPNISAVQELPSKVSHTLVVRTYFDHEGFDTDFCYFTFIPRAFATTSQDVTYLTKKKDFIYELIPQSQLDTYLYNNNKLPEDTVKEMEDMASWVNSLPLSSTEKDQMIRARIGQGKFKRDLLELSDKCHLCSVSDQRFLIGSHIKPWSKCVEKPEERIDPNNGFLLCPNHDSLFDKGLISFQDSGEIIISPSVDALARFSLNIRDTDIITINEKNLPYLQWHRTYHKDKLN